MIVFDYINNLLLFFYLPLWNSLIELFYFIKQLCNFRVFELEVVINAFIWIIVTRRSLIS